MVINDSGQPAQSALTFPSTPIALAASGLYILAACTDGVHVYDRTSASWVQSLPYPPGVTPSPGQSIITAYNNKGSCVLFSGLQKVSLLANLQFAICIIKLSSTSCWSSVLGKSCPHLILSQERRSVQGHMLSRAWLTFRGSTGRALQDTSSATSFLCLQLTHFTVSTSRFVCVQVMLFQPIALDEQAKDLLRAGQYEQALNLANVCAADGAPWAETAFAQTALMLLHGEPLQCASHPVPSISLHFPLVLCS